jgi:subtilisin family serine protease
VISDRVRVGVVVLLCLAIGLAPETGRGAELTSTPGELIVAFEDEESTVLEIDDCMVTSTYSSLNYIFSEYELVCARPLFQANSLIKNVFLLKFPSGTDLDALAEDIEDLGIMSHVSSNPRIEGEIVDYVPGDYAITHDWDNDGRNDQWTYYLMQVDRAWDVCKGDTTVIVAVLDTGIEWGHRDLRRNLWINPEEDIVRDGVFGDSLEAVGGDLDSLDNDGNGFIDDVVGWDFHCQNYPDSVCPDPYNPQHRYNPQLGHPHTHGSQMASIISAVTDNPADSGMAGIGFKVKVMGVRCAEYDGLMVDIFEGTQYAIDNGAHFLSMSFTLPTPDPSDIRDVAAFAL